MPSPLEQVLENLPRNLFPSIISMPVDGVRHWSCVVHDIDRGCTVGTSDGPKPTALEALELALHHSRDYVKRHGEAAKPIRKVGPDEIPGITYVKSQPQKETATKRILPRPVKVVPKVSHPVAAEPLRKAFGRRLT